MNLTTFKNYYLLQEGTTSYGCLMAYLPKEDGKVLQKFTKEHIDKENLSEDGIEDESHCTVLYGFHGDLSGELKDLLHKWGPLKCKLGKISRFKNKEKEFDVIKVEVESPDIEKLHYFLKKHYKDKITTSFPIWKGHITLAYVKPGTHKELDGDTTFKGEEYTFEELVYSSPGMKKKTKFPIVDAELVTESANIPEGSKWKCITHDYFKRIPAYNVGDVVTVGKLEDRDFGECVNFSFLNPREALKFCKVGKPIRGTTLTTGQFVIVLEDTDGVPVYFSSTPKKQLVAGDIAFTGFSEMLANYQYGMGGTPQKLIQVFGLDCDKEVPLNFIKPYNGKISPELQKRREDVLNWINGNIAKGSQHLMTIDTFLKSFEPVQ